MSFAKDTLAVAKLTIATGGSYWFGMTSVMSTKILVALVIMSSIGSLEWYGRRKHENT